jgi:hypothetical protein
MGGGVALSHISCGRACGQHRTRSRLQRRLRLHRNSITYHAHCCELYCVWSFCQISLACALGSEPEGIGRELLRDPGPRCMSAVSKSRRLHMNVFEVIRYV